MRTVPANGTLVPSKCLGMEGGREERRQRRHSPGKAVSLVDWSKVCYAQCALLEQGSICIQYAYSFRSWKFGKQKHFYVL